MRTAARVTVATVSAALLTAGGLGAYNFYTALTGDGDAPTTASAAAGGGGSGPPSASEVGATAKDFLAAWGSRDAAKASALTNNDAAAETALSAYFTKAHVVRVALRAGTANGATVPFTVDATVSVGGHRTAWRYASSLRVVRGVTTGRPLVDWQSAVVHPRLRPGQIVESGSSGIPDLRFVDRHGARLDPAAFPSLRPVLNQLKERYGSEVGGTSGTAVWAADPATDEPGTTLLTLTKGSPATMRTTIDAGIQRAAEKAVSTRDRAGAVAIKPSTGEILAIADNTPSAPTAMQRNTAPGSTFKIITSAALLSSGKVTPSTPVPCNRIANYDQGKAFHNVEGFAIPGATLAQDFASSCNTAFVSLTGDLPDDGVARVARDAFGIGKEWSTGTSSYDGSVPGGSGDEKAAEMIGQGRVQMSPLTMASVAATVKAGYFRQPIIVDRRLGHRTLAEADGLSSTTASQLRGMMRLTATSGTAAPVMRGLSGSVGAKTGSAEVDGQETSDSWFTAYQDDVAAAAMVPAGGHGVDAAGPIVRQILVAG